MPGLPPTRRPATRSRVGARHRHGISAAAIAFAAAWAAPPAALADVYKCVDAGGRTIYQEAPCAKGQQGGALAIRPDPAASVPAAESQAWSAAAADRRVVSGMPMRWVIQALGSPAEKRAARSGERATQVWVYPGPGEILRVGFAGDAVAWTERDPVQGATPLRDPAAWGRVAAGRSCDEVLAELGTADAKQAVGGADPKTGEPRGPAGTRYTYESGPGDKGIRLSFTCVEDRVVDIERDISTR